MKRVYFVRHGESVGNAEGVFKDPQAEMTHRGHEQAKALAERCAGIKIDKIVSSPLKRAQQTATYIADACALEFEVDPNFSGTKYASKMVGKSKDGHEAKEYFRILRELYKDPDARYEDAENFTDMKARYSAGLDNLLQAAEETVLVVTHEAPLKSILLHVLLEGRQTVEQHIDTKRTFGKLDHGSLTELQHDGERWKLIAWNDRIA